MKNGLEVTSQIVDIWENAELMTKKIQVAKTKVRNRIPKWMTLKVSYFQNEFMKSSFIPKYEQKIVRISALCCSYFGRNDAFINSF